MVPWSGIPRFSPCSEIPLSVIKYPLAPLSAGGTFVQAPYRKQRHRIVVLERMSFSYRRTVDRAFWIPCHFEVCGLCRLVSDTAFLVVRLA